MTHWRVSTPVFSIPKSRFNCDYWGKRKMGQMSLNIKLPHCDWPFSSSPICTRVFLGPVDTRSIQVIVLLILDSIQYYGLIVCRRWRKRCSLTGSTSCAGFPKASHGNVAVRTVTGSSGTDTRSTTVVAAAAFSATTAPTPGIKTRVGFC